MPGRNTAIELIADKDAAVAGETLNLMVRVRIRDHWHIYWKNPGDSGEAIRLKWALPNGVTLGEINWPTPKRLPFGPLVNFGYEKEARFTIPATLPQNLSGTNITFAAKAEVLVCEEICIPEYEDLTLTLPVATSSQPDNKFHFNAAFDALPSGTDNVGKYYEAADGNFVLMVPTTVNMKPDSIFPEEWGVIDNAAAQQVVEKRGWYYVTVKRGTRSLDGMDNMMFVVRDAQGLGTALMTDKIPVPVETNVDISGLFGAIALALLGGLILNLMPCVFPILSLKALSLVKLSQSERTHAQKSAIAYACGIILCFVLLAAVLIGLRGAGASIGWGFQLQSPVLVTALAWLMALVGFNLLGFFELRGLGGIGDKLTKGNGLTASFWTGVLAAVVATPCTAPFMATALGYALVQPAYIALLVFVALGIGLALPFLLISFVPYLARHLPKPGAWMEHFRAFLAFPMFAASLWLVWVAENQIGDNGVLFVAGGIVLMGFVIWLARFKSLFARIVTGVMVVLMLLILSGLPERSTEDSLKETAQAFSQAKIDEALAAGRPVFVNMTAKWCVTCMVNDKVAISTPDIQKLFEEKNILYLKGDWTNQDEDITQFLNRYGRSGVPLYVYYHNGKEDVLPQLLTPQIVANAIGR